MIICVYLTPAPRKVVGVEDSAVGWVLGLPCSSLPAWSLGYVLWWWNCVEQQWLFKLFLCSWFPDELTQCNPVDGLTRVYCGGFIWSPAPSLVDSKPWQPVGDSPAVCVWCAACTLLCEQPSCVCVQIHGTWLVSWLWDDQLGRADPYLLNFIILLTCQVVLPLGITSLLLCLCTGTICGSIDHEDHQVNEV
jgi:hypothetical protein